MALPAVNVSQFGGAAWLFFPLCRAALQRGEDEQLQVKRWEIPNLKVKKFFPKF